MMSDDFVEIKIPEKLALMIEGLMKRLGITSFEEYVRLLIARDESLGTLEERREAHRKMRALVAAAEETDSSQN